MYRLIAIVLSMLSLIICRGSALHCVFHRPFVTRSCRMMSAPFDGNIPLDKLDFSYSRSSGPGGQNVNKVNTKAEIR